MALEELTEVLGREYRFKPHHSTKLIEFIQNTESLADSEFRFGFHVCRASAEKFVLKQMPSNQLEKLLQFHQETLPRIMLNGHEMGYKRASTIHQGIANIYSKMFDRDSNPDHLEKAIEHSVKSMEYSKSEAHESYTCGFIGEYARKIFQQTKNLPFSEKSIEAYQKSRDLSVNDSHRAHCLSYMGDIFRDRYEITKALFDADKAINNYINSAEEIKKIKPAQTFHNLSFAADVAFSVFANTENLNYLKKSHSLYHMALRECKQEEKSAYARINILRGASKLYDRLHAPSFVQEAFHQTIQAIQHNLTPRSETYIIAVLSDLCVKLPPDFVILQDNLQKLAPFAQKFPGDHRAHVLLSSIYRNKFAQTKNPDDANITFESLDKAIETANDERQKAFNSSWAGRTTYNIYTTTKNIDHLVKAYDYHENASAIAEKSQFYAGLCAQELYDITKDEQWKNKALSKYVQYLNSSSPDFNKANNAKEHIQELTE